jgi:calcineurin-like phosphoesterase family protein
VSNIFFTSDTHFMHRNILKFCPDTRLGADAEEMKEILIQNWNKQVTDQDTVYILGDVFFCKYEQSMEIINRLRGKINLIFGNHDQVIQKNPELMRKFESAVSYRRLYIGNQLVILHHYPYLEWEQCHRGAYALFGHVHGSMDHNPHCLKYRTMDVGVDSRPGGVAPSEGKMTLWTWEQIDSILSKREKLAHH